MNPVPEIDPKKSYLKQYEEWVAKEDKEALFKTPTGGFKVNTLFLETSIKDNEVRPFLTWKTRHYKGHWSFPMLYKEIGDLVEYKIGERIFYNYKHFVKISKSAIFRQMIKDVRADLETKMRSDALEWMAEVGRLTTTQPSIRFAAAKFFAKREWVINTRLKKEELQEKVFSQKVDEDMEDDLKLFGEQFENRNTKGTN